MHAVVAARDTPRAGDAMAISIRPRRAASASSELHETTLAHVARFITVEHTEDTRIRDAIDVTDDAFAPAARDPHAGVRAEIVQPARCGRGTEMSRGPAQPFRHLDLDERTQRAIDEQQEWCAQRS